jgi:hypothetical protein
MNWYVIIIMGLLAIALIVFLIIRNQKEKIDLEEKLNDDYIKPKHEHIDTDMDRKTFFFKKIPIFLHSSLFTLHSSLFTLHSSLSTLHSSLFTLHSSLFTLHSSLLIGSPVLGN